MKIIKEKTVSFTGHRTLTTPSNAPDPNLENVIRTELYYTIRDLYYEEGFTIFISGMAAGFDMMAAETVLEFKKSHNNVQLYAIIPFLGQEQKYSTADKLLYKSIFERVDDYVVITDHCDDTSCIKRNE